MQCEHGAVTCGGGPAGRYEYEYDYSELSKKMSWDYFRGHSRALLWYFTSAKICSEEHTPLVQGESDVAYADQLPTSSRGPHSHPVACKKRSKHRGLVLSGKQKPSMSSGGEGIHHWFDFFFASKVFNLKNFDMQTDRGRKVSKEPVISTSSFLPMQNENN